MITDNGFIKKRYWQFFVAHIFLFLLFWLTFLIFKEQLVGKQWVAVFAVFVIAPYAFQHTYFGFRYRVVRPNSFAGGPVIKGKKAIISGIIFLLLGVMALYLGIHVLF